MTTRPTVLASIVLALALLGESLLYAVLPLHAAAFGVSLVWVGVLLSANRIVRLFVYPFLPRLASAGVRRFTVAAAALAAGSTFAFAVGSGAWVLLASRIAWGVAFGSLSLATLAYATASRDAAGTRVGLSLSLRELGPLLSLTAGTAAVTVLGVRPALAVLGAVSLIGVVIALRLPDLAAQRDEERPAATHRPRNADHLSLFAGFVADGIFPATVGLLLARSGGAGEALVAAGMLLAFKRIAIVLLAPLGGRAVDRFSGDIVSAAGFTIAAAGALLIGFDHVIAGALLLSCGAAVTTASIPAAVAGHDPEKRVGALARVGMARDAGGAAGTLAALALFDFAGAATMYSTAGLMLALVAMLLAVPRLVVQRGIDHAQCQVMRPLSQPLDAAERRIETCRMSTRRIRLPPSFSKRDEFHEA